MKKILVVCCLSLALAACGGDGGDSSSNPTDASPDTKTKTGVFLDAPVKGLSFSASPSNKTGMTNENGEFQYLDGDEITFSFNGITLGIGKPDAEKNIKVSQFGFGNAFSVAQLLQTLDTDATYNIIDVSDVALPEDIVNKIKARLSGTNDLDGDILAQGELNAIHTENAGEIIASTVIERASVLNHLKEQFGEQGLMFTSDEVSNQLFVPQVMLTQGKTFLMRFASDGSVIFLDDDGGTNGYFYSSSMTWTLVNGEIELDFPDEGDEDSKGLIRKIAQDAAGFDAEFLINNSDLSDYVSFGIGRILKPQAFSTQTLADRTINMTFKDGSSDTVRFYANGTFEDGDGIKVSEDVLNLNNTVELYSGTREPIHLTLIEGTLDSGTIVGLEYSLIETLDAGQLTKLTVMEVNGNAWTEKYSFSVQVADGGSSEPEKLTFETGFTAEWLNGKLLYSVYQDLENGDINNPQWSENFILSYKFEDGKIHVAEGISTNYIVTFDYSITDEGMISYYDDFNPDSEPDFVAKYRYIHFNSQNDDFIEVCHSSDREGVLGCTPTTKNHEVFFWDSIKAKAASDNPDFFDYTGW